MVGFHFFNQFLIKLFFNSHIHHPPYLFYFERPSGRCPQPPVNPLKRVQSQTLLRQNCRFAERQFVLCKYFKIILRNATRKILFFSLREKNGVWGRIPIIPSLSGCNYEKYYTFFKTDFQEFFSNPLSYFRERMRFRLSSTRSGGISPVSMASVSVSAASCKDAGISTISIPACTAITVLSPQP